MYIIRPFSFLIALNVKWQIAKANVAVQCVGLLGPLVFISGFEHIHTDCSIAVQRFFMIFFMI